MKVVVSFTTSPTRISKTKIMIDSILNQSRKPDFFLLNIPKIFPRTGRSYIIPDFIKNNDNIIINVIDRDYGPATKVIPTIQFIKENNIDVDDTRIIYVDDDIKQLPNMISTFLNYSNNENIILGTSGFSFGISIHNSDRLMLNARRGHLEQASVIEGYGAVCLSPKVFKNDFLDYFEPLSNIKYCLLSDDVVLSNYYNKNKNKCIIINTNNISVKDLYKNKCILDYGNQDDALHILDGYDNNNQEDGFGNIKKYVSCLKYFRQKNMLYFNIEKVRPKMKLVFYGGFR